MPVPSPSSADASTSECAVLLPSGLPRVLYGISHDSRDRAADPGIARPRVLFIDDEVREEDALVRLLALEGFDVVCATSGAEALDRARSSVFAAIVLDLHLRDILGLTVLSELRRTGTAVPVVIVTGWYLDDGHENASAALGAAAFLRKPVDASALAGTLRAAIAAPAAPLPPAPVPAAQTRSPSGPRDTERARKRPSDDLLSGLRQYAMCGDDAAVDQILTALLPVLRQRLRAAFATAEDDWIHDAAVDALMEYRARPDRYDPARGVPLSGYLLLAARRNLINRLDKERRRTAHEETGAAAPLPEPRAPADRDTQGSASGPPKIRMADVAFTESERTVLRLLRAGERRTDVYAMALGLGAFSVAEQRVRVKQIKNRLMQRIRRLVLTARLGWGTASN
jgi:CheY-like chemotaxis protein